MMLGNRGETAETFRETLRFLERAQPHEYIFSCLSIYPGTIDFQDAERAGWVNREVYFTGDFQELKTPFDASEEDTALMSEWFSRNKGLRRYYTEGVDECLAILGRLGDYHGAHMDLGGAYYEQGRLEEAEKHVHRALELGYPAPGLAQNYLACISFARGDIAGMQQHFLNAAKVDPQHHVLVQNVDAARRWFRESGPEHGLPLNLTAQHEFQLLERTEQPTLPGPLPADFADWSKVLAPLVERVHDVLPTPESVMLEGHETIGFPARRLPVV
jgi:tetratricopeptide (TPR) repeat protein